MRKVLFTNEILKTLEIEETYSLYLKDNGNAARKAIGMLFFDGEYGGYYFNDTGVVGPNGWLIEPDDIEYIIIE